MNSYYKDNIFIESWYHCQEDSNLDKQTLVLSTLGTCHFTGHQYQQVLDIYNIYQNYNNQEYSFVRILNVSINVLVSLDWID